MAFITKTRGTQSRANEQYNPNSDSLATDKEVEDRVKKHSAFFHSSRNQFTEYVLDGSGTLTDIMTYVDDTKTQLHNQSNFTYTLGVLTEINKRVYENDGITLYSHTQKLLNYLGEDLIDITTVRIV